MSRSSTDVSNRAVDRATGLAKRLANWMLWPGSSLWLTDALELALHWTLKVQAVRYYWLAPGRPNFPHSRAAYFTAYRDRNLAPLIRGFYTRQALAPGGRVLTIGCGDGFNDYFFLSRIAGHIDAVDVQPDAIRVARRYHGASNLRFHALDAVRDRFPHDAYDLVVMDGCIAHFPGEAMDPLLGRIAACLRADGFYVGSEVMESPDRMTHDHLQAFPDTAAMERLLAGHFPVVQVWQEDGPRYSQVFWRCANSRAAFDRMEERRRDTLARLHRGEAQPGPRSAQR